MPRTGKGILTKRENASLNSETCSSVRESACRILSAHFLESCHQAVPVLISKAGYGSGRAARGLHTMLDVWGGLAKEEREMERERTGRWVQVTMGLYKGPVWCVKEVWLCLRLEGWWSWAVRLTLSGALRLG